MVGKHVVESGDGSHPDPHSSLCAPFFAPKTFSDKRQDRGVGALSVAAGRVDAAIGGPRHRHCAFSLNSC
jgi:hypothetical protein